MTWYFLIRSFVFGIIDISNMYIFAWFDSLLLSFPESHKKQLRVQQLKISTDIKRKGLIPVIS